MTRAPILSMQHVHFRQMYSLTTRQVIFSERKKKEKMRENRKTEESLPQQIGTGSLCGNYYERSLNYSNDVTHLILVKSILWYRCVHDRVSSRRFLYDSLTRYNLIAKHFHVDLEPR